MYTVESTVLPLRVYDPYWRLHQAWDTGGWLVDSARVVSESPADPERNITPALLAERFEKVAEVGDVWRATPDEVIDYILMRRAAHPRALSTLRMRPSRFTWKRPESRSESGTGSSLSRWTRRARGSGLL